MNLFSFEEDNLNVDDVYQVDIYNSRFEKHFCQTPRNDFDFDDETWFENRSLHALDINIVEKKMKEISKARSLSRLFKSWRTKLSYLFIPMSTVLCHATKDRQRISSVIECSDISREALILVPHLHTSRTRKVILTVQNFPIYQRRTDEYFQLQGMFSSCNIGSVNVLLTENWE